MTDQEALHKCVTKFMIDTCHYSTSEYATTIPFFHFLGRVSGISVGTFSEFFTSGSSAEFRIKPMLSCIGDIDLMQVVDNILAIPHGYTPPTELPDLYQDIVPIFEIIDSHQPGYVYLKPSYILNRNDNGSYVAISFENRDVNENDRIFFRRLSTDLPKYDASYFPHFLTPEIYSNSSLVSLMTPEVAAHGPAMMNTYNSKLNDICKPAHRCFSFSSIDSVQCIRCLLWPPLASNWPTRYRDHGWPDQTTINMVVNDGCDVVGAVHPRCKQEEWVNERQWRLSFSRAEVTLLNSWTPVQQILYHMLRFVMKREVFAETNDSDQDAPKLSNYHIKTLMLWECEQKPQSWWLAESSLVKLCSSLLHKLSGWVNEKRCHHYFINDCNILDHFADDASSLSNSLKSLADESVLLPWFVENYIRKCAERCPAEVSELFQDICSFDKQERAVQAVVDWKWNTLPEELYMEHFNTEAMIQGIMLLYRIDVTGVIMLKNELHYFDPRLRDYFVALTSLRVAYTITTQSLTEDLLEILWTLFDPCNADVGDMYNGAGILSIKKAIKLARMHNIGGHALEMLYQEISKAYLHHCLACGQECTRCVVHVLLATLCYKSGHYQTAVYHCKQLLNQGFPEHHRSQSIGAEYLPQIDDNVDSVFGLVILYRYVQGNGPNGSVYPEEINKLPSITTLLLAHYLYFQCQTVENRKCNKLAMYRQHLSKTQQLNMCDVLLFEKMEMELDESALIVGGNARTDEGHHVPSSSDPSLLVTMLELVALEKLITFRHVMVRELHSEQFPILNEFEALYSYKCGLFEECLEMCRNHVNLLLRAGCSRNQVYVIALPQFVSLLNGELVSLFGIIGILHPVIVLLLLQFPLYGIISVLTLSLYLLVQCQKKLRADSLVDSLQLIHFVHDKMYPADDNEYFVDRLILKLTYRSLKLHVDHVPLS